MAAPRPRGVYVHVPFCAHRCHYCDFSVATPKRLPIDEYMAALESDVAEWFDRSDGPPTRIRTLYIGGGTPSLLGGQGMAALAELLRTRFAWDPEAVEWTAEANPNSLDGDLAAAWFELGVNRLSIGVQSFEPAPLTWLGRLHDAEQAKAAVQTARAAGFESVNVDLIFGLPTNVSRDWKADVSRAVDLGATHVSAYGLTAEKRTPLGRWVDLGRVSLPGEKRYAAEYLQVSSMLVSAGFEHYEVSNFALPGQESRHNWLYWDDSEYLGLGPSAHSFLGEERIWNVNRWDMYRKAAEEGRTLREGRETPDAGLRSLERTWLGLRTTRGLDPATFTSPAAEARLSAWLEAGWMNIDERVRLTPEGWLRLDALAAEIAGLQ